MRAPGCRPTLTLSPPPPLLTTVAPWHGPSLRGGDPFDSLRSLRVTWGAKRRTRAGAIGHGLRVRCRTWTRTRLHPGATTPSSPHSGQDAHCTMRSDGGVGFQPARGWPHSGQDAHCTMGSSHLSPLTSYHSPLTTHHSPLTSPKTKTGRAEARPLGTPVWVDVGGNYRRPRTTVPEKLSMLISVSPEPSTMSSSDPGVCSEVRRGRSPVR
jgi:hypothetical protein